MSLESARLPSLGDKLAKIKIEAETVEEEVKKEEEKIEKKVKKQVVKKSK